LNIIEKEYKHPEYLVETEWLENNIGDSSIRIFDCTVNVERNPDEGLRQKIPFIYKSGIDNFNQSHIPHAGYIDVANDLSDSSSKLPLMMPTEEQFLETIGGYGISNDSHVVLYSTTESNWAARVWWLLHSFGFKKVSILNGGWKKWSEEGRPVSDRPCEYVPGKVSLTLRANTFVDKNQVLKAIDNDDIRIINALPTAIYEGSSEFIFGRKGRITNSLNVPFVSLHDDNTGSYLSANQLHKKFDEVNVETAKNIITYCGGGIAASNNAFVLALLGYKNVSVYDGSMLEWGNDASLPMEVSEV